MPNRSNRIEVDLKLLQDKNVEKLQEFGRQFDKSIDKLASMLGSYAEQVSGATQTVARAGKVGPEASRSDDVKITGAAAGYRMGGQGTGGFGGGVNYNFGGGGGGSGYGRGEASVATPSNPQSEMDADAVEKAFVRAQMRAGASEGAIPVGLRQALGYAAEGVIKIPGMSEEQSVAFGKKYNEKLFQMEAIKRNALLGMQHLQNFYGANLNRIQLGQQLGSSREGGVFGIFSPAWTQGVRESIHSLMESDFGFSPYYSTAQAKQARETLQQYGYSGQTSDYLADQLKQLQVHRGLDPQAVMAILDPLMRFGGDENMGQLLSVLQQIPDAAKAAHMNLSEFTQQLISTSQEVAQGTGMTVGGAARALSAFTTTTGLSPSRAAGLFNNPQNLMLAAGMSGQSITSLMEGNDRMAPRMAFGLRVFEGFSGGYTAEQLASMRKKDWKKYQSIMNSAWLAYAQNKDIFGGFSPRELINMQTRNNGRLLQHTTIDEELQSAASVGRVDQLLKGWGGAAGQHMQNEFETYLAKNPNVTVAQARQEALDLISKSQNAAQTRTARQVTKIDMTPETKKFFKLLNYDDTAHSNSKNWFERNAMPALNDAMHAGEDILTHFLP